MEIDKYISLGDSFINFVGDAKEVIQFIVDTLDGKKKMVLTTKPLPKTPVNLTKKNFKKYLK